VSSRPVFVTPNVIWTDEEKPCDCGPGGASQTDGTILAHDLNRGTDSVVDTSQTVPGIGGPPLPAPTTTDIVDTWM
jgi:hypothetical protein